MLCNSGSELHRGKHRVLNELGQNARHRSPALFAYKRNVITTATISTGITVAISDAFTCLPLPPSSLAQLHTHFGGELSRGAGTRTPCSRQRNLRSHLAP